MRHSQHRMAFLPVIFQYYDEAHKDDEQAWKPTSSDEPLNYCNDRIVKSVLTIMTFWKSESTEYILGRQLGTSSQFKP